MDKSLIEKYKAEMLGMYRSVQKKTSFSPPATDSATKATAAVPMNQTPIADTTLPMTAPPTNAPSPTDADMPTVIPITDETLSSQEPQQNSTGRLIVVVTTVRSLYPLENARVTVFSGDYDNMQVIARDTTDQSGRTDPFVLATPSKSLSLTSGADGKPYSTYNIEIKAEGYVDSVYLNVPVFSGVTSIQRTNMLLLETAGKDKGPVIVDETQQYTLGET